MRIERFREPTLMKLALLLILGAVFAWRIFVVNVADQFAWGDAERAATALKWDSRHPGALYAEGANTASREPAEARQSLEAAIRANPADGRSYAALARVLEEKGDMAAADRAMTTAAAMAPRRLDVQGDAGAFWMRRGNLARSMQHWDVVLTFGVEARPKVFPALLTLAEDPGTQHTFQAALVPLLQQSVKWWPDFFAHVAANAQHLDTVRALYGLQGKGANDATPAALRAYLERLQREGYWTDAYFVWLNSLKNEQLRVVGDLFNGGFEEPISNLGFDWISVKAGHVLVETAPTYGATGSRALHVVFRGPRVAYRHLGQYMMLPPAAYSMRGRARPDSLQAERGIQ